MIRHQHLLDKIPDDIARDKPILEGLLQIWDQQAVAALIKEADQLNIGVYGIRKDAIETIYRGNLDGGDKVIAEITKVRTAVNAVKHEKAEIARLTPGYQQAYKAFFGTDPYAVGGADAVQKLQSETKFLLRAAELWKGLGGEDLEKRDKAVTQVLSPSHNRVRKHDFLGQLRVGEADAKREFGRQADAVKGNEDWIKRRDAQLKRERKIKWTLGAVGTALLAAVTLWLSGVFDKKVEAQTPSAGEPPKEEKAVVAEKKEEAPVKEVAKPVEAAKPKKPSFTFTIISDEDEPKKDSATTIPSTNLGGVQSAEPPAPKAITR